MKNAPHTTESYPKLLNNQPCGEDFFVSKSHEKIASQIAKLLQGERSIHAIGIDGGWGVWDTIANLKRDGHKVSGDGFRFAQ